MNILMSFMISACIAGASCEAEEGRVASLEVGTSQTEFDNGTETFTISVSSDDAWTISFDDWWVEFSEVSGTASGEVTCTVQPNNSPSQRTGTITVSSTGIEKQIKIVQMSCNHFTLDMLESTVSSDAGKCTVNIKSNTGLDVIVPETASGWVFFLSEENGEYTFVVRDNKEGSSRTANILFHAPLTGQSETFVLTQEALVESPSEYTEYKRSGFKLMPILGYWGVGSTGASAQEGLDATTKEDFLKMARAGFNMNLITNYINFTLGEKLQSLCEGTGVRQIIQPTLLASTNAESRKRELEKFKTLDMICGYWVFDEPDIPTMKGKIRERVDIIRAVDQDRMTYVNLLPMTSIYMGTDNYEEYITAYMDLNLDCPLSFDFYPFEERGQDNIHLDLKWYENLDYIRTVTRNAGIPFWSFILSTPHYEYAVTESTIRFQAWTILAYGGQGLEYFTYRGITEEAYEWSRLVNEEAQGLADVFMGNDCKLVRGIGYSTKGVTPLAEGELPAPFKYIRNTDPAGLLMSSFTNDGHEYVMIVNLNYMHDQLVEIDYDEAAGLTEFVVDRQCQSKFKTRAAAKARLIAPGDMALYMIR